MGETKFKIYSLLLVKNEVDIVKYSLLDACRWSNKIIVIDNGSTDGTWELIKALAEHEPKIIPFMRYEGPFHIGLRAMAFRAFRKEMHRGDWWCVRLDADEFYEGDVRSFLCKVPLRYRTIKKSSRDYVLTKEDIADKTFTGDFGKDKEFITHYLPRRRRERRFVRHSPFLYWKRTWRYPHLLWATSPESIPVNHYQYRSPEQMKKRFFTRQQAKADGCGSFKHEQGTFWTDYLLSNQELETLHTQYKAAEKE